MTMQFPHTADELRAIADLLDAMNKLDKVNTGIGVGYGPEIWWYDRLMGHVVHADEEEGVGEWCYRSAKGDDK